MQDQHARSRRIVQLLPGQLDLLHLAQDAAAKVLNGIMSGRAVWSRAELTVQLLPSEPLRSTECEGAVDQPEVEIEAQRATFEGREGIVTLIAFTEKSWRRACSHDVHC